MAWAAAIWWLAGPTYQGESVAAVTSGAAASEPARVTATLIEVKGLRVIPLLLASVVLTALAALAGLLIPGGSARRGVLVLVLAVVLLGFSVVGAASTGLLFLPAAIILVVSGVIGLKKGRPQSRPAV